MPRESNAPETRTLVLGVDAALIAYGVAERDGEFADGVGDGESPEELDGVIEEEGDTGLMQMPPQ